MSTERRCTGCGEIKPLSEFWRNKKKKHGRSARCIVCSKAAKLNRLYGPGAAEKKAKLFKEQGGRCAICQSDTAAMNREHQELVLDHCHITDRIRGVLCHVCNLMLGYLEKRDFNVEPFRRYAGTVRKNLQD